MTVPSQVSTLLRSMEKKDLEKARDRIKTDHDAAKERLSELATTEKIKALRQSIKGDIEVLERDLHQVEEAIEYHVNSNAKVAKPKAVRPAPEPDEQPAA